LRFSPGKGFFCRELDPKEIYDLYPLRKALEIGGIKLSVERAKDAEIDTLERFLMETGPDADGRTTEELVKLDETFHEGLMKLSGNNEMLQVLRNVNARIQFVRWVDMDRVSRPVTQAEHRRVVECLRARDIAGCIAALEKHIDRRQDQITSAIKEGFAQIYLARRPPVAATL
ncbi:MAG: GntR family transcriptional regulator, partial [Hyphomicrobiaceae bacterium]